MSSLSIGTERRTLRPGDNTLGGQGADAVPLAPLAWLAPAARIVVPPRGPALIHRLSAAIVVRLDGEPLGAAPRELRDGARLDVGALQLRYEDSPATQAERLVRDAAEATLLGIAVPAPSAAPAAQARLVDPRTSRAFPLDDGEVVIGRDATCDIVLTGPGVSRRHARVTALAGEFAVTDESANGTYVNGARVNGAQSLRHGDVIGFHGEELRLELAASRVEVREAAPVAATQLLAPAPSPDGARAPRDARAARDARPLATLEVTRGALAGTSYRVERPVCAIGRGEAADVRLLDDSVSTSHASLLFKAGAWYVVDLRSSNGTFVDGYRVAGERVLAAGASLRVGSVEMTFRPGAPPSRPRDATRHEAGLLQRLSRRLMS